MGARADRNNLTGLVFGRLTVVERTEERRRNAVVWKCKCSCGEYKVTTADMLKRGQVRSCGCLQAEKRATFIPTSKGKSKYTTDSVSKEVAVSGCRLLSEYSDLKTKMRIECPCGNVFSRTFPEFKRYNKECPKCSYKHSQNKRRLSLEHVQAYLKKIGVSLLSKTYENKDTPLAIRCKCGKTFMRTLGSFKTQGAHYCDDCSRYKSGFETEVGEFLKAVYPGQIVPRENNLIRPYQLDFYMPDKGLAIETNGLYYHTEVSGGKGKMYHLNKWSRSKEKGVRLIHISDHEWAHKNRLIKGLLTTLLSDQNTKINTRECTVTEISTKVSSEFLNEHHLQGSTGATTHLGLFHNSDLVAVMTFGLPRYSKVHSYELIRFCIKTGYHVPGAADKLFKSFVKTCSPDSVVSYCDISKFSGTVYEKLGFKFLSISKPGYSYVRFSGGFTVESRQKFQKHKLHKLLRNFDPNISEWENMKANGYDRYWDCGNAVYVWKKQ